MLVKGGEEAGDGSGKVEFGRLELAAAVGARSEAVGEKRKMGKVRVDSSVETEYIYCVRRTR